MGGIDTLDTRPYTKYILDKHMNEFLKMDVFFFVTTVAVVVITIIAGYVLWQLRRVLKYTEHILKQVAAETDIVREDLVELRSEVRRGKGRIKSLFGFFNRKAKRIRKKV